MRSIPPSHEIPEPFKYEPWSFWVEERGSDREAALDEHLSALSAKFQSACAILRGEVASRKADADDPEILRTAKYNAIDDIKSCFDVCLTVCREGILLQGSDEGFDACVESDLEEVDKLFETMTESFDELYEAIDDSLPRNCGESSTGWEVSTLEDGGTRAGRADVSEVDSDVLMVIQLLRTSSSGSSPSSSQGAGADSAR